MPTISHLSPRSPFHPVPFVAIHHVGVSDNVGARFFASGQTWDFEKIRQQRGPISRSLFRHDAVLRLLQDIITYKRAQNAQQVLSLSSLSSSLLDMTLFYYLVNIRAV